MRICQQSSDANDFFPLMGFMASSITITIAAADVSVF